MCCCSFLPWGHRAMVFLIIGWRKAAALESFHSSLKVTTSWIGGLVGELTNVYEHLKGGSNESGARVFLVLPRARTRGNGIKWSTEGSLWTPGTLCCAGDWRLAQAAQRGCRASSVEILKSYFDTVLGNQLCVSLLDQMGSKGPCQPQPYCDSSLHLCEGKLDKCRIQDLYISC